MLDETPACERWFIFTALNHRLFLHLYLQFYYISVAVTLFRVHSTVYIVRIIFEVLP